MNKFKEFTFIFGIICFDCQHKVTTNFLVGNLFNIGGDLILSDAEYINFSNRNCQSCQLIFSLILKRFSYQEE